jgi:hypothetical protein
MIITCSTLYRTKLGRVLPISSLIFIYEGEPTMKKYEQYEAI